MRSPNGFFSALHWRRARWRDKQTGNDTANDCAVKILVIGQVGQYRISATAAHCQLNGTFAQSLLKFVEIEIVPAARIADDDDGLGFHPPASRCPKILVIVERGTVTDGATIDFPCRRCSNDDQHDCYGDAAPGQLWDRPHIFERGAAMYGFDFCRVPKEQPRQAKPAFKIGNR